MNRPWLASTQWLVLNLSLTSEPVLDPLPSTDRSFGDPGLYVDTLNVAVEHNGLAVVLALGGRFYGLDEVGEFPKCA